MKEVLSGKLEREKEKQDKVGEGAEQEFDLSWSLASAWSPRSSGVWIVPQSWSHFEVRSQPFESPCQSVNTLGYPGTGGKADFWQMHHFGEGAAVRQEQATLTAPRRWGTSWLMGSGWVSGTGKTVGIELPCKMEALERTQVLEHPVCSFASIHPPFCLSFDEWIKSNDHFSFLLRKNPVPSFSYTVFYNHASVTHAKNKQKLPGTYV